MKSYNKYILLVFIIGIYSCNSKVKSITEETNSTLNDEVISESSNSKSTVEVNTIQSIKKAFVESLKNGENLSKYFIENWTLIYHEDNRCDGSTDGEISNLANTEIDKIITVKVKNDGDGWACDKKEPKNYSFDFNLKEQIKNWDRFEIANYESDEKNSIYILGAGESDYLKLHYNASGMIIKLEYKSEDPG